jgi:predicted xylose isomerase-like sugar epimerase
MYEQILYETGPDDGIATVTLNRPDRLNAWTPEMEREVRDAMQRASAAPAAASAPAPISAAASRASPIPNTRRAASARRRTPTSPSATAT